MLKEYSPDLAAISKKESKKSHVGTGDGITITSIKHKPDTYEGPSTNNAGYNSQSSRTSQISNTSDHDSYGRSSAHIEEPKPAVDTNKYVLNLTLSPLLTALGKSKAIIANYWKSPLQFHSVEIVLIVLQQI